MPNTSVIDISSEARGLHRPIPHSDRLQHGHSELAIQAVLLTPTPPYNVPDRHAVAKVYTVAEPAVLTPRLARFGRTT